MYAATASAHTSRSMQSGRANRHARLFIHTALFSCLFLDKFGIVMGRSYLSWSLPIFAVALTWVIVAGRARISARLFGIYCLMAFGALSSFLFATLNSTTSGDFSAQSLVLLLVLYGLFVFEPRREFDTSCAVDIYLKYALVLAVLGILQFLLQFIGVRISSLSATFPALQPFLVEQFYNSNAILQYGSIILRSNAIFLREPSVFSQLLVTGLVLEIVVKRRWRHLPIYFLAYLTTYSGTGLLCLFIALAANACFSLRQAVRLPLYIFGAGLVFLTVAVVAPDVASQYTRRIGEFSSAGTSAYARYLSQGHTWSEIIADGSIVTGHGPGTFGRDLTEAINSNPAIKFTYDYGISVMLASLVLFALALWAPEARLVSLLFYSLYEFGGGTELSPNFLIVASIICVWGLRHECFRYLPHTASRSFMNSLRPGGTSIRSRRRHAGSGEHAVK